MTVDEHTYVTLRECTITACSADMVRIPPVLRAQPALYCPAPPRPP
jgi:hypothetical protein